MTLKAAKVHIFNNDLYLIVYVYIFNLLVLIFLKEASLHIFAIERNQEFTESFAKLDPAQENLFNYCTSRPHATAG